MAVFLMLWKRENQRLITSRRLRGNSGYIIIVEITTYIFGQ